MVIYCILNLNMNLKTKAQTLKELVKSFPIECDL